MHLPHPNLHLNFHLSLSLNLSSFLYRTLYILVFLVLTGLLLITPADIISQARQTRRLYDVVATGGIYFLTLVGGTCVYASRWYTNRTVVSRIPRGWIPIERTDIGRRLEGLIKSGLRRSKEVRRRGRPRDVRLDISGDRENGAEGEVKGGRWLKWRRRKKAVREKTKEEEEKVKETVVVEVDWENIQLVWQTIEHPGWSGSTTRDYPDLHYATVVGELLNIIEAKAVALASSSSAEDDGDATTTNGPGAANPERDLMQDMDSRAVVEVLQRPAAMGMRDYLARLASLGVIHSEVSPVGEFLARYEYARFSERDLSEEDFRKLMSLFAEILHGMRRIEGDVLLAVLEEEGLLDHHDDGYDDVDGYHEREDSQRNNQFSAPSDLAVPPSSSSSSSPSITSSASTTRRHPQPRKTHLHHQQTTRNGRGSAIPHRTPSSISLSIYSHHSGVLVQPDQASSSSRRSSSLRRSSSSLSDYASSVIIHRPPATTTTSGT